MNDLQISAVLIGMIAGACFLVSYLCRERRPKRARRSLCEWLDFWLWFEKRRK